MMNLLPAGVRRAALLAVLTVLAAMLGVAAEKTVSLDITSFEQFDACTRDAGIDVMTNRGAVQLTPVDYIVEDMGNKLGSAGAGAAWGKKVFMLDSPVAAGATVYVFRNVKATFNGAPLTFKPTDYGAWLSADIPANALKAGANNLVMESCAVPIDVEAVQTRHSFVSTDRGATWKPVAGEFLAHLRVYRFPSAGTITSDVIDLANPEGKNIICPQIGVSSLSLTATAQAPKDTEITLEARSGGTARPDDDWSDWAPAKNVKPARFLQWRAKLATKNHGVSPILEAVVVKANVDIKAEPAGMTVTAFNNPRIVRSSFPFTYQEPSDKLALLRYKWKLDAIVAPGKTEMERYLLLRNWVRLQWPHNEGNCTRPWDAINILNAPAGDHGMCVHYGVTYTQCALALGYNARQIILNNHYVSEIWVNDLQKWVLMDVETVQPEGWDRYGTAIYLNKDTGKPLNGLEIHRALKDGTLDKITQVLAMSDDKATFKDYERTYGPEQYGNFRHFAFPPRNNFLDQLEPWEVSHGVDHYHSNYYYWWSDTPVATRGEYSQYSCREGNLYWTINQAALTLTATPEANVLDVRVDTETPNFKEFRYSLNGAGWQTLEGDGEGQTARAARFTWELRPGTNTLEIKPRSIFGMDGITTMVAVKVGK
ncbi:MAG: hypothetical protein ACYDCO_14350 [Armatimonadota bacterium]